MRGEYRYAMFSGTISRTYQANADKHGNMKVTFTLQMKPAGKKGHQNYVHITSYELSIQTQPWFREGSRVYTQCEIALPGFYLLNYVSTDSYECYRNFIERVYKDMENDLIGGEEQDEDSQNDQDKDKNNNP